MYQYPAGHGTRSLAAIFVFFSALAPLPARAVDCTAPTDATLTTQAEVDAFAASLAPAGCDSLRRTLTIEGADVSDLSSLTVGAIRSIRGNLVVRDTALTDLSGLESIASLTGTLQLRNNDALLNIDALSSLTAVGNDVQVRDHALLGDISGLDNLNGSVRDLRIDNNDALNSIAGLSGIATVRRDLTLRGNDALASVSGLNGITTVARRFEISNAPLLASVTGLAALAGIGDRLEINNSLLTDIDFLSAVPVIPGRLRIINNDELRDLAGLSALTDAGADLVLSNNAKLADISALVGLTGVGRDLVVNNNDALTNLTGLDNIADVGRHLQVSNNALLTSIAALSGVRAGAGNVRVISNPVLASIEALSAVDAVSGFLQVANNTALDSLTGLDNIATVNGYVAIANLPALTDVAPLASLTTVGGYFQLRNVDTVANVNGLAALISVTGNLQIDRSRSLVNCAALIPLLDNVDDALAGPGPGADGIPDVGGDITIERNAGASCDSINAILNSVADFDPPSITLLGDNPASVEAGATYSDAGATALDDVDGPVPAIAILDTVDTGAVGTYLVRYRATDAAGNSATRDRTVDVVLPPVKSLSLTPDRFDFGGVALGESATSGDFTLTNDGTAVVSVSSFTNPSTPFTRDDTPGVGDACPTPPFPLAAGSSCTITYGFRPTTRGEATQGLAIVSDADASPNRLNLSGKGLFRSFAGALPGGGSGLISFSSADGDCEFDGDPLFLSASAVVPAPPASLNLVDGVVNFTIAACAPGATVDVVIDYGADLPADAGLWKAGTPWRVVGAARVTGSSIAFSLTDGGPFDDDGEINGRIVDPSGAATSTDSSRAVHPVPSLPPWALLALALLLSGIAASKTTQTTGRSG